MEKQKQPWGCFELSIASNMVTTSCISGLLLGSASQHFFITLAKELGQFLGICGLKFCIKRNKTYVSSSQYFKPNKSATYSKEEKREFWCVDIRTIYTTAEVNSENE